MNYLEQFKQQQLRRAQLKQLTILEEIDRICRKHNIKVDRFLVLCVTRDLYHGMTT